MKRFLPLLLTLASFGVMGCGEPESNSPDDSSTVFMSENYYLIKVRGCEYVSYTYTYHPMLVHAGDCTNPIHQPDTTSHR